MSKIESRLREREEARKAAVAARRLEKEKETRAEETYQYFTEQFSLKKTVIEKLLEVARSLPKSELPIARHFDVISKEFQSLHRLVSDATLFLAAFELKTTQEQVSQLQAQVTAAQDQLLPKKKFAFRSRPKKATVAEPSNGPAPNPSALKESTPSGLLAEVVGQTLTGFSGREKELLTLPSSEINSRDLNLSDLKDCEVKLFGSPVTLHMSNMDNCCVQCGPVSSSVFMDNCRNCTFVVACQQLRVHTTVDSTFYLHVTSKAIIEDCTRLQFAPYNLSYPELHTQFQESGLSEAVNNWSDVDDFNWLVPSTPSPNWTILSQEKRRVWD